MSYYEKQQPHDPYVAAQIPVQAQAPPPMPKIACCTARTASIVCLILQSLSDACVMIATIMLLLNPPPSSSSFEMSGFNQQSGVNVNMQDFQQIWRTACIISIVASSIGLIVALFGLYAHYKGKALLAKIHLGFVAVFLALLVAGTTITATSGSTEKLFQPIFTIVVGLFFFFVYHCHYKYCRDVELYVRKHSGSLDMNSYRIPA